ncbi:MAG TPA: branched-chain amino acid ABC transporter permease [Bradyrhizobium sp.]|jgi:branched-chain amino acid transport system permease protein|nr:branched-chain amino acid ABC transporter permease [Bradyrhizobium sp.]
MTAVWISQILQGVLLGGLYTLFAIGLSLSAGALRFVNIAHGDFIVLACFALFALTTWLGVDPVVATLCVLPLAFVLGFVLQRFLLQRVVGENVLLAILVTFGLSIIIENGLLEGFGADTRKVSGGWIETATIHLAHNINVGLFQVVTFIAAVVMVAVLDFLLYRTDIGAKIRAVSDDVEAANMIGLSSKRIYATAMGITFVTIGIAAGFMSIWTNFDPSSGPDRLLIAFEVIVLGGLGSLWGSLIGGIVLGVAQSLGGQFDIAWQMLAGHIVFLIALAVRPQGLFPKY